MNNQELESLYRVYSVHLKQKYGEKVYKLPVNIPCGCPNRDGTVGFGGCIFCGASGSGYELLAQEKTVTEQLTENSLRIKKRYKANKFISYFQSFSNTYLPFEDFSRYILESAKFPGVVEIAIATRPDCVTEQQLDFLRTIDKPVTIELGLQTANDHTLEILNRGHTVDDFIKTSKLVKNYGFNLCTHVIADLPWDSLTDIDKTTDILNLVQTDYLKIHSLYVEKGTVLEKWYRDGLKLLEAEDYINRSIRLLERLNPNVVIERLIGRIPEKDDIYSNWGQSWWKIKDQLVEQMLREKTYQGKYYVK